MLLLTNKHFTDHGSTFIFYVLHKKNIIVQKHNRDAKEHSDKEDQLLTKAVARFLLRPTLSMTTIVKYSFAQPTQYNLLLMNMLWSNGFLKYS